MVQVQMHQTNTTEKANMTTEGRVVKKYENNQEKKTFVMHNENIKVKIL